MIANDKELAALQARVQTIEAILAYTRQTLSSEDFELQSKGWMLEWDGLQAEIRQYLSTPAPKVAPRLVAAS